MRLATFQASHFPAGEQRPRPGSQAGQRQARWAYALDYYQDRRPSLRSRHGLINQFLSSNHMAISQLRVLASVGPARAAGAEGQAPGQDMEKRERDRERDGQPVGGPRVGACSASGQQRAGEMRHDWHWIPSNLLGCQNPPHQTLEEEEDRATGVLGLSSHTRSPSEKGRGYALDAGRQESMTQPDSPNTHTNEALSKAAFLAQGVVSEGVTQQEGDPSSGVRYT